MRIQYHIYYRDYKCPNCKHTLKRESMSTNDNCSIIILCIVFFPIWLIILGIKFFVNYLREKDMIINSRGENVVRCRRCKSYVAFVTTRSYNDYYVDFIIGAKGTRLLSEEEIFELKKMGKIKNE